MISEVEQVEISSEETFYTESAVSFPLPPAPATKSITITALAQGTNAFSSPEAGTGLVCLRNIRVTRTVRT